MASQPDVKEEFHFIGAIDSLLHPLHKHDFKVEGLKFNCIQQYVIRQKLEQNNGRKHLSDLMKADPPQLKKFEDSLKLVISPSVWTEEQKEATKRAYLEKSLHLKALHDLLSDTKGKVLVYANPKDSLLGIGLTYNDPNARRRSNWKGKNLLGEWLKEVQEEMPPFEERSGSGDRESRRQQTSNDQDQQTASKTSGDASFRNKNGGPEKFTFFWRKESPFSQWHPCSFVIGDQWYNCAEQYMMHQKAVYFSDYSNAKLVLQTKDPKEQKSLGRKVKGFDDEKWDRVSKEIVKKGNMAKFGQNEDLRKKLFATEGTTLVEASPVDDKWGIGLAADDSKAQNRKTWRGENRLGEVLTEVRDELMRSGSTPENENAAHRNDNRSKSKAKNDSDNDGRKTRDAAKGGRPSKRHGSGDDSGQPPSHRSKPERGQSGTDDQEKGLVSGAVGPEEKGRNFASDGKETEMEFSETPSDRTKSDDAWDGFGEMDLDIEVNERKEKKERRSRWSDRSEQEMNDGRENSRESSRRNKRVEQNRNLSGESDSEKFTFFWRAESPFSQHHPANFVLNGVRYNCAEQYMMHMKAVVFGDERIGYEIMSTSNPAKQKSLAKQVNGFDDNHWKTLRRDVVKSANIAKFSQNPRLRRMLLATAGTTMVEASPVDNTWGIGLNAEDPRAWRKSTWAGTNILGEILTEVREELMKTFTNSDDSNFDYAQNFQHSGSGESYTIFWRPVSPFHPKYPVGFVADDVRYWTLLQYIVHQKALFFGDVLTAREALENSRPNKLEELGRKIRNYDHPKWSRYCRSFLVRGNFAKFSQNPNVRQQLIDNIQSGELVYCVEDRLLGIGFSEDDPRVNRKKSWKGKNLLGQSLMEVREMILENKTELPEIVEIEADEADEEETSENIFFFFTKSPFSQWQRCSFKANGLHFTSAEQYMLHQCALHFNDRTVASEILRCRNPRDMQNMYPQNYNELEWNKVCRDIIKAGNYAKFSQDYGLRNELMKTEDAVIAYSAENDTQLGIGLRDSDSRAWDRRNWPGQNLLGEVLMEVRNELKQEKGPRRSDSTATDRSMSQESIASLPPRGKISDEKFTFFWQKSPFSQWFKCDIDVNDVHYNCTEQHMMHQKALHFKDDRTAADIMKAGYPGDQFKLGRSIKNYNSKSWNAVCRDIVKQGNLAKFQQHHNLRKQLFATAGTTLVEASPLDPKWGIGVKEQDRRARNRDSWPGRNLLGEILMEIREELLQIENGATQRDRNSDIPGSGSGSDLDRHRPDSRDDTAKSHVGSQSDRGVAVCQSRGQPVSDRSGGSKHSSRFSASGDQTFSRNPEPQLGSSRTHAQNENRSNRANETTATGQLQSGNIQSKHQKSAPEKNFKDFKPDPSMSSQTSGVAAGVGFHESGKSGKLPEEVRVPSNESHSLSKADSADVSQLKEGMLYIVERMTLNPWFSCSFKADGFEYNSVGQYLYHQKALMFKDEENADEIMGSTSMNRVTRFAKRIEGCENKWNSVLRNVLKDGNYHKFLQNEALKHELLASSGKTLVYADSDKVLGIGLKPNDKHLKDQSKWTGKNLLGYVLMELCEDFVQGRASLCERQGQNSDAVAEPSGIESKAETSLETDLKTSPSTDETMEKTSENSDAVAEPSGIESKAEASLETDMKTSPSTDKAMEKTSENSDAVAEPSGIESKAEASLETDMKTSPSTDKTMEKTSEIHSELPLPSQNAEGNVQADNVKEKAAAMDPGDGILAEPVQTEDVKLAETVKLEDGKFAEPVKPKDEKLAESVNDPGDGKFKESVKPKDGKSTEPDEEPEDMRLTEAVKPEDGKSEEPVKSVPVDGKFTEPVKDPGDGKSTESVKPEDVKLAEPAKPEDRKLIDPDEEPEDASLAEVGKPEDERLTEPIKPKDAKLAEPVQSEHGKLEEPVKTEDGRLEEPVKSKDGKSAEPVQPEDGKLAEPANPKDRKLTETDEEPEDVRLTEAVKQVGGKSAEPFKPGDGRLKEPVKQEDGKTLETGKPGDDKLAEPVNYPGDGKLEEPVKPGGGEVTTHSADKEPDTTALSTEAELSTTLAAEAENAVIRNIEENIATLNTDLSEVPAAVNTKAEQTVVEDAVAGEQGNGFNTNPEQSTVASGEMEHSCANDNPIELATETQENKEQGEVKQAALDKDTDIAASTAEVVCTSSAEGDQTCHVAADQSSNASKVLLQTTNISQETEIISGDSSLLNEMSDASETPHISQQTRTDHRGMTDDEINRINTFSSEDKAQCPTETTLAIDLEAQKLQPEV